EGSAWVPRSGVYAVREGPILAANLRARLKGARLRCYRPQRDALALLNLGGRRALGAKRGRAFAGRLVWRWKDRIDRRFVARFRPLAPDGAPVPGFAGGRAMRAADSAMECGGCAAKLGADELARALSRLPGARRDPAVEIGLALPDDAAALRLPGGDLVLA